MYVCYIDAACTYICMYAISMQLGVVTGASQVQTVEVVGASGVEHMTMNGRHFLAFLTTTPVSRSTRHTVVYEWIGKTVAAATASALPLFRPLQSLETPGGAWALKLMTFSTESHFLMVSMKAACHTQQSGLFGQCAAMLRWNGDKFAGPFNTQATSLTIFDRCSTTGVLL